MNDANSKPPRPVCATESRSLLLPAYNCAMKTSTDVVILGGGVIGLACALQLLEQGRAVTVLEQGTVGCGASNGNCGTLTPSHAPPLAMPGTLPGILRSLVQSGAPLHLKPRVDVGLWRWLAAFAGHCNRDDFQRTTRVRAQLLKLSVALTTALVERHGLDCGFRNHGTMHVYRDAARLARARWLPEALREVGITVQVLDGREMAAREPALLDGMAGGHYFPGDAQLEPAPYVAGLAERVRQLGGRIEEGTQVQEIARSAGRIDGVHTTRGLIQGSEFVLALGAWTPLLARQLGLRLPIQPGKGYSLTWPTAQDAPKIPLVLRERQVCVSAWSLGLRLGSTMEFAGYDTRLRRVRLAALQRGAHEYLRQPQGEGQVQAWYGWRPMSADDLPLVGRAPGLDNLIVASGHGMLGVTLAAVTGLLVGQLVCGQEPAVDLTPLDPGRAA